MGENNAACGKSKTEVRIANDDLIIGFNLAATECGCSIAGRVGLIVAVKKRLTAQPA
jgi:hypothetical protein